ncbi:MAG: pilus assembly protein [Planctomycetes bacterium]|nr:pilus assembly protein [Planctomycetota bacterium]
MRRARRSGQSLVEFALVALVLYLLLAATIELGRATFGAQALQDVARVAARELALEPLPAEQGVEELFDPDNYDETAAPGDVKEAATRVQRRIYARRWLVVDLAPGGVPLAREDVETIFADMPLVNRMLRPLMIYERTEDGRSLLRYPGALLLDPDPLSQSGLTVAIPEVARDPDGVETVAWREVLELGAADFALTTTGGGLAVVSMNYPFQAAAMVGYRSSPDEPFEPNMGAPLPADDASVVDPDGPGLPLAAVSRPVGPYAGTYGLGVQLAYARQVRPFRRLITLQAAFRREVFQ